MVEGLTDVVILSEKEIMHKYNTGKAHRKVAETQMNS